MCVRGHIVLAGLRNFSKSTLNSWSIFHGQNLSMILIRYSYDRNYLRLQLRFNFVEDLLLFILSIKPYFILSNCSVAILKISNDATCVFGHWMISSDWSRKLFRDANKGVRIIGILTALQKPTHLVLTSVFFLIYKFKEDIILI